MTKTILTELPKPSSSNIHASTSERVKDEQRAKAKTDSNVLTIQTLVGFAEKAWAKTLAAENLERVSLPLKIKITIDEDMDESADAYQAHNGSDDGEEALDYDDDEENDTFSSYVALDDVTVFEAPELDAIALLADTRNDDLDPQLVQNWYKQAHKLILLSERKTAEGKGKAKGKGKGRCSVRPSHLSLEDRRRLKELKPKTECHACGR